MGNEVDEYGVPIKKTNEVEVDEYGVPLKKKVGTSDGLTDAQKSVKKMFGSTSNLVLKSQPSKSSLESAENKVKSDKFLGAGKYDIEKTTVSPQSQTDIKLQEVVEGGLPKNNDQLQFSKSIYPVLPLPSKLKDMMPKTPTPELTYDEAIAKLDLYKDVPQEAEIHKAEFLKTGTGAVGGELQATKDKKRNDIKLFVQETKDNNSALISSKPTQQDRLTSDALMNIKDVNNEITADSPDGSDTGYWLQELDNYKNTGAVKNSMLELNGRLIELPTPLKKAVEDYYYYLYNNDNEMYKKATSQDISERDLMQVVLASVEHQQNKMTAEYQAKNDPEMFSFTPNTENWKWDNKQLQEASQYLTNVASDYLSKSPETIATEFRNAQKEEAIKKLQQTFTDAQYEKYKEDGGFFAHPLDGLYYNVVTPTAEVTNELARGFLTLPRTVGLDEDFAFFEGMVDLADKYYTTDEALIPTEYKESFNWNNGFYKVMKGLGTLGTLIYGTKGLSAFGLSKNASLFTSSFVLTQDKNFQTGISSGMNKDEAQLYSNIISPIEAVLERISPNSNLVDGFRVNVTSKVLKDIAEGKAVKLAVKDRTKEWAKTIPPEIAQEFAQLGAEKATNYLYNSATGSKLNTEITAQEVFETGIVTLAVTGIANLGTFRQTSDLSNNALYQLSTADNKDREEIIRKGIEDKSITQEQGQNIIDSTNDFRKILAGIPNRFNAKQKMDIAGVIYQKQLTEKQEKEKIIDPVFEKEEGSATKKLDEELKSKIEKYDSENKAGLPSEESKGKEPIETESIEEKSETKIGDGGMVQKKEPLTAIELDAVKGLENGERVFFADELTGEPTELKNEDEIRRATSQGYELQILTPDEVADTMNEEDIVQFSDFTKGENIIEEVETPKGITKDMFEKVENGEVIENVEQDKIEKVKEVNDNFDDIIKQMNEEGELTIDCEI